MPLFRNCFIFAALLAGTLCLAQQRDRERSNRPAPNSDQQAASGSDNFVARMLTFDKNKDGSISTEELNDTRLKSLFTRADTDKNGIVTKQELQTLHAKESPALQRSGRGGGPGGGGSGGFGGGGPGGPGGFGGGGPGGPGGFGGGPGGFGGGGPGGPGGFGPPERPQPGVILSSQLRDALQLNAKQVKQLDALQAQVTERLAKILTAEQQAQLKQHADHHREGPGFRGDDRFSGDGRGPGRPPREFDEGNRQGGNRPRQRPDFDDE